MAPGLTPFDLLVIFLSGAFVAALAGWAGGRGGLRSVWHYLHGIDDSIDAIDIRLRRREGAAGQVQTQKRKTQLQERDAEAEKLAAQLAARGPPVRALNVHPALAADLAEEEALEQLESEAKRKGLLGKG